MAQTTLNPQYLAKATALATDTGALGRQLDSFAASFGALASLMLAAPSAEVINRVRDPELCADWPHPQQSASQRGITLLLASGAAGEEAEVIRRDYSDLFVGPHRVKVSPYESVHRSVDGLLFDAQTLQVRQAYANFGLVAPRLNKEPDDHLGLELGFLSTLCISALDAIGANDRVELERTLLALLSFLDNHLLTWAPEVFTRVEKVATTSFYQAVGGLGLGTCVAAERAFLTAP